MTRGRVRLLLVVAALVGGAVGGTIGWLTGDVLAGAFVRGTLDDSMLDRVLVLGGLGTGALLGAALMVGSTRKILSEKG